MLEIASIPLPLYLFKMYSYLVKTEAGFALIDTGKPGARKHLLRALADAGCEPGSLTLIVLTHGDSDHSGNAAYLRETFGAKIALHEDDWGMVEHGDMFWNRRQPNAIVRRLFGPMFGLSAAHRFTPDIKLNDGDSLVAYGLDASVLHLPGHSAGSIGILTAEGDLFCGDLLGNTRKPALWIIDDPAAAKASVNKLRQRTIRTVYPGHGKPFSMATFTD